MRKRIATWLINNGSIDEEEREIYEYAIQSLKLLIMPILYAVFIGWVLQEWIITMEYVFLFSILRKFSGGYHAKTELQCMLFSLGTIYSAVYLVNKWAIGFHLNICYILSVLILLKYSPVDSENRKLDKEERKKSHRIILFMQILLIVMYFLMWKYGNEQAMKVIAIANICVAIFQLIGIGTNMLRKKSFCVESLKKAKNSKVKLLNKNINRGDKKNVSYKFRNNND